MLDSGLQPEPWLSIYQLLESFAGGAQLADDAYGDCVKGKVAQRIVQIMAGQLCWGRQRAKWTEPLGAATPCGILQGASGHASGALHEQFHDDHCSNVDAS